MLDRRPGEVNAEPVGPRRCDHPGFADRFRKTPDHPVRRTSAWRRLAKRTVEAHVARHGWICPGWQREPHPA